MEARNLSLNDVVQAVNNSNLILPAGDVRIGSKDFNIYANSQFPDAKSMNEIPLKSVGNSSVLVADMDTRRILARFNTISCGLMGKDPSMFRFLSKAVTATQLPS